MFLSWIVIVSFFTFTNDTIKLNQPILFQHRLVMKFLIQNGNASIYASRGTSSCFFAYLQLHFIQHKTHGIDYLDYSIKKLSIYNYKLILFMLLRNNIFESVNEWIHLNIYLSKYQSSLNTYNCYKTCQ